MNVLRKFCVRMRAALSKYIGVISLVPFLAAGASTALAADKIKMTIGYQTQWATIGNTFEALRHTNILELYGIEAQWKPFTFGGPLGEAFVAGAIDNIIAAEAPVIRAASRKQGTKLIARVLDYRFGILVQPDFKGGLADLRGKKVSAAFGGSAFALTLNKLSDIGMRSPLQDVSFVNQEVAEMVASLSAKSVTGIVMWDPTLEKLAQTGAARPLYVSSPADRQGQGWLGVSKEFHDKYGDEGVVRFLEAFIVATWWTSNHIEETRKWFSQTSRIEPQFLAAADGADRNLRKPIADVKNVDLTITEKDIAHVQGIMDLLNQLRLVQAEADVKALVDNTYLTKAQKALAERKVPLERIRIVTN